MAGNRRGALTMSRNDFRRGVLTLRREDGRIICETVQVADTILRRMRGLLGRASLEPGRGPTPPPRLVDPHLVHAVPDRRGVRRPRPDRDPYRTVATPVQDGDLPRGREVVELAAGECERRGLEVGDRVAWASRSSTDDAVGIDRCIRFNPTRRGPSSWRAATSGSSSWRDFCSKVVASRSRTTFDPNDLDSALEDDGIDAVLLDVGDRLG